MVSKFALLSNLLLASVALAIPSSRLEARLARRREGRQSSPISRIEQPTSDVGPAKVEYSSNWAGAVVNGANGTFTSVTGTFTLPTLSGGDGAASAWVGIDGDICGNAILQTGIDFVISSGVVSYEVVPRLRYDFSGISLAAGDVIKLTVTASSTTSSTAVIQNLSTSQNVTKFLTSSSALCESSAEWIVQDFEEGNSLVPFPDFGIIEFTNASASGPYGTYTPCDGTVIELEQNSQVLTSVSTSGCNSNVTIQYI
ncbi:peptidase A4 family-domain-containing protein [Melanogaster broomeanus]|nr:peptidase A4 family-domain-containing protein [Melanogaster broomeanus]